MKFNLIKKYWKVVTLVIGGIASGISLGLQIAQSTPLINTESLSIVGTDALIITYNNTSSSSISNFDTEIYLYDDPTIKANDRNIKHITKNNLGAITANSRRAITIEGEFSNKKKVIVCTQFKGFYGLLTIWQKTSFKASSPFFVGGLY